MNKKEVGVVLCLIFVIVLMISFVSAGFFSNLWGKITGKVVVDTTPRVSFWSGKVNQHTENGVWKTDPDGVSGASYNYEEGVRNRTGYCQKFYEGVTSAQEYGTETINTWCDVYNTNCGYTATRTTYECVGGEQETTTTPTVCGNGFCDANENCITCDEDCGCGQWEECDDYGNCVSTTTTTTCTDNDVTSTYPDGKNYYTNSYAKDIDSTINDGCIEGGDHDGWLREAICSGTDATWVDYDCSSEGKVCSNGACVTATTTTTTTTCVDSDGGKNFNKKGYVSYGSNFGPSQEILFNETAGNKYIEASWTYSTLEEEITIFNVDIISTSFVDSNTGRMVVGTVGARFTNVETGFEIFVPEGDDISVGNLVIAVISATDEGEGSTEWTTLRANTGGTLRAFAEQDKCTTGSDIANMMEYYCADGVHQSYPYKCPYGCVDGACVASTTQESYCSEKSCVLYEGETVKTNRYTNEYIFNIEYISSNAVRLIVNKEGVLITHDTGMLSEGQRYKINDELEIAIKDIFYSSKETTPSKVIFEYGIPSPVIIEDPEECTTGCYIEEENTCYPICYRKTGMYCSGEHIFKPQRESEVACDNSCECKSNICAAGECLDQSFIQSIIDFFRNLLRVHQSHCELKTDNVADGKTCYLYTGEVLKESFGGAQYYFSLDDIATEGVDLRLGYSEQETESFDAFVGGVYDLTPYFSLEIGIDSVSTDLSYVIFEAKEVCTMDECLVQAGDTIMAVTSTDVVPITIDSIDSKSATVDIGGDKVEVNKGETVTKGDVQLLAYASAGSGTMTFAISIDPTTGLNPQCAKCKMLQKNDPDRDCSDECGDGSVGYQERVFHSSTGEEGDAQSYLNCLKGCGDKYGDAYIECLRKCRGADSGSGRVVQVFSKTGDSEGTWENSPEVIAYNKCREEYKNLPPETADSYCRNVEHTVE